MEIGKMSRKLRNPLFLTVVLLILASLLAQCAPAQPEVIEKVVTVPVEVEKTVIETQIVEVQVTPEIVATAPPPEAGSSAERAITAAKQYAGSEINVVWEAGLQPQDPLTFAPQFTELTGVKVNIVEMAFGDLYSKQLQDHLTGGGSYDVITFNPSWLIDFVNAGVVEPLNPYIDQHMNKADLEDYLDVYGAEGFGRIGETWYGLPDDGDVFLLYYRKDLFEDEANKTEFQEKFGYELAPPPTYKEFNDICSFFTEKYQPDLYGCAFQHLEGQAFEWFTGPFSGAGGQFFNPETMEPGINGPEGVELLTNMVNVTQYMPPGVQKWGFTEVLSAWMDGKLAMAITWPPIGRWSEGVGLMTKQLSWVPPTKVASKVGYAMEPGGRSSLAGGFALGVSPDSQNKEAAYLFIQWMNSPDISLQRVMLPFALRDPFRKSHFQAPLYRALWEGAPDYLKALEDSGMNGQFELGIPGAREYMEALDNAITSAYSGTDPQAALDEAARRWEEITDRLGRDSQKQAYETWLQGQWNQPGPK
jgi:multiple sugar transport system substrate-binding protein